MGYWVQLETAAGDAYRTTSVAERWKILEKIGEGSFAVVKRAQSINDDRQAAIKMVQKREDVAAKKMILREIIAYRMVAAKQTKNVVSLYEISQDGENVYLVMELLRGGDLSREEKPLPESVVVKYALAMVNALRICHHMGVTHRDITPMNFMKSNSKPGSVLKLMDFGVSFYDQDGVEESIMKTQCGTPKYMAPEVVRGQPYDSKCDMWSVGAVLFELLTGSTPFNDPDARKLLRDIRFGVVTYRQEDWKGLSEGCQEFIKRLLTRDCENRMSAPEAIQHPWLAKHVKTKPAAPSTSQSPANTTRLQVDKPKAMSKAWKSDAAFGTQKPQSKIVGDKQNQPVANQSNLEERSAKQGQSEKVKGMSKAWKSEVTFGRQLAPAQKDSCLPQKRDGGEFDPSASANGRRPNNNPPESVSGQPSFEETLGSPSKPLREETAVRLESHSQRHEASKVIESLPQLLPQHPGKPRVSIAAEPEASMDARLHLQSTPVGRYERTPNAVSFAVSDCSARKSGMSKSVNDTSGPIAGPSGTQVTTRKRVSNPPARGQSIEEPALDHLSKGVEPAQGRPGPQGGGKDHAGIDTSSLVPQPSPGQTADGSATDNYEESKQTQTATNQLPNGLSCDVLVKQEPRSNRADEVQSTYLGGSRPHELDRPNQLQQRKSDKEKSLDPSDCEKGDNSSVRDGVVTRQEQHDCGSNRNLVRLDASCCVAKEFAHANEPHPASSTPRVCRTNTPPAYRKPLADGSEDRSALRLRGSVPEDDLTGIPGNCQEPQGCLSTSPVSPISDGEPVHATGPSPDRKCDEEQRGDTVVDGHLKGTERRGQTIRSPKHSLHTASVENGAHYSGPVPPLSDARVVLESSDDARAVRYIDRNKLFEPSTAKDNQVASLSNNLRRPVRLKLIDQVIQIDDDDGTPAGTPTRVNAPTVDRRGETINMLSFDRGFPLRSGQDDVFTDDRRAFSFISNRGRMMSFSSDVGPTETSAPQVDSPAEGSPISPKPKGELQTPRSPWGNKRSKDPEFNEVSQDRAATPRGRFTRKILQLGRSKR